MTQNSIQLNAELYSFVEFCVTAGKIRRAVSTTFFPVSLQKKDCFFVVLPPNHSTRHTMNELITQLNDALWGYVLIGVLTACGLWFTWKTRGVQFRMVGEMFRLLTDSATSGHEHPKDKDGGRKHISSFQAFAVSVATRVGTGNLAGVATAIAVGGPGAVFWMWTIALIGSATAFVESTLGQLFKQRHEGWFIGGPAYYILKGRHCRWMAYLFAVLLTLTFGLSYNSIQSNTICGAMQEAFGWSPLVVGIVLSASSTTTEPRKKTASRNRPSIGP
jgi:AGCS family alanine or glycine:cation symporter